MCMMQDEVNPQLPPYSDQPPQRQRQDTLFRNHKSQISADQIRSRRLHLLLENITLNSLGLLLSRKYCAGRSHFRLKSPNRGAANLAFARQMGMYLAHVSCTLTMTEAGHLYGRDRTTVAHACGIIEDRRDEFDFDRMMTVLEYAAQLGLRQIEPEWAALRQTKSSAASEREQRSASQT
jgi:hypothetical protein